MTTERCMPPRPAPPKVHNHGPEEGRGLACPETRGPDGRLRGQCLNPEPTTCAVVDGVAYTQGALRELVRQRHELATEVAGLREENDGLKVANALLSTSARRYKERLERADRQLRLRTSALTRLIARKGPHFESITVVDPETWMTWRARRAEGQVPS